MSEDSKATAELRWSAIHPGALESRRLQQKWVSTEGVEMWRDIPWHFETANGPFSYRPAAKR